jgi:hypothetical protein
MVQHAKDAIAGSKTGFALTNVIGSVCWHLSVIFVISVIIAATFGA